jgi:uncharacterized protein YhfF
MPFVEHFDGETPQMLQIIDDIAEMAVRGLKRGTCHLAMQFEHDKVAMRNVGDYWIVVKTDGTPVCVVQIIAIEILPFNRVGPVFAASEGPEDGGLPTHAHWFALHEEYFREQCDRWSTAYRDDLPVVCESFITVYSPEMPWGKGPQQQGAS